MQDSPELNPRNKTSMGQADLGHGEVGGWGVPVRPSLYSGQIFGRATLSAGLYLIWFCPRQRMGRVSKTFRNHTHLCNWIFSCDLPDTSRKWGKDFIRSDHIAGPDGILQHSHADSTSQLSQFTSCFWSHEICNLTSSVDCCSSCIR